MNIEANDIDEAKAKCVVAGYQLAASDMRNLKKFIPEYWQATPMILRGYELYMAEHVLVEERK
jgi:hypothetical protein